MAWIKIEHHTPRKPEVLRTASALHITPAEAFLDIFNLWCWGDINGINGRVENIDYATINAMLGRAGLCEALEAQGWMRQTPHGVAFPKWDAHNGESAKQRANAARRASRFRNAPRNDGSVTKRAPTRPDQTRPERREEKNSGLAGSEPSAADAGLAGCLAEHGVGEPARSILARTDLTPERVAAIAADIRGDAKVADPVAVLVGRLKAETGAVIPKSSRGRLKAEDAKLNGVMLAMREQARRTHVH